MTKHQSVTELSEEELHQLEEKQAGSGIWGESTPRQAKHFWPAALRMLRLLATSKGLLALVVLLNVGCVVLAVWAPKIMGHITDLIFAGAMSHQLIDFGRLGRLILVVIGMYVVSSLFQWAQGYLLNQLVMRSVYQLRQDIAAKLHRLPLHYFDSQSRGDLMSRTTNDADNVQTALTQGVSQLLYNSMMLTGIIVMMFSISWLLALVALLSIPLTGVAIAVIGKKSQQQFATQWKATGELNGQVEEAFSGHDLATVYGRMDAITAEFTAKNQELYESATKAQFLSGMMMPIMQFVSYLSYVFIAVLGALRVANGQLTLGGAQAFIQYSREFNQPLGQLGGVLQQLQSGVASAERVFEFLDAAEQTPDPRTTLLPARVRGQVEFRHVDFSYPPAADTQPADRPLIQDLSLRVEPGQTVAIVGPTGAGKTTLVNLLMRFYDIDSGQILLDGVDTATMSRAELRSQVGMVLQDAVLFSGTIFENIRYGRPDATDAEVRAAAEACYVDRFVHALPDGYDTLITPEEGAISAGERQLITIARAFLAQPALLILDEATSAVDTRTEMLLQEAMNTLRAQRTSFIIAHRLSTIRDADLIIVMAEGRIVEQGSHAALLAAGGAYSQLNQAQFTADA